MLRIGTKELIFSKAFTLNHGEQATFTPPELPGAVMNFRIREKSEQTGVSGILGTADGQVATFELPYTESTGHVFSDMPLIGQLPDGSVSGRISVHFMGTLSHVVVEAYLQRNPSFRQR
jgi:hypothetical protein